MSEDRTPTQEELNEIKGRVANIRAVLEDAGLLSNVSATTGTKIVRYITETSGSAAKDMTIGQWNTVLATLDGLVKDDPAKAVEAVNEACGLSKAQIEAEAKAVEQQRAKARAEIEEANKQREAQRKQRDEQAGPHTQRIKELSADFLRKLEAEGYEGYVIVGVPNYKIESRFDAHLEECEHCQNAVAECERLNEEDGGIYKPVFCDCEPGLQAGFEDQQFDTIFVYKTLHADDEYGSPYCELVGGGVEGNYPYISDLLDIAEPYKSTETGAAAA